MLKERKEIYEFGTFRLDISEHIFSSLDGAKTPSLPEKAFQTLCILVRNHGHLLTKQELLDQVWPDSYVEENNLDKCIHAIRNALNEKSSEVRYIQTVRKHGYRFVADVRQVDAPSAFSPIGVISEKKETAPETVLPPAGKVKSASARVSNPRTTKSGQHAIISMSDWQAIVERSETQKSTEASDDGHLALETGAGDAKPLASAKQETSNGDGRRRSKTLVRSIAAFGLIIVSVAAVILGVKFWRNQSHDISKPVAQRRLTVEGGVTRAAISHDGRFAAVAQNAALILFDIENGGQRVLIPASKDIRIMTIAFPSDGSGIYFGTRQAASSLVSLFSIPLGGGEPTKILDDIYGSLSFSPDNKKIAFVRRYAELNEYALLTADADGSNIGKLASSRLPNRFEGLPAWSPDGSKILCPAVSVEDGFHFTIARIEVSTGLVDFVPDQRWTALSSVVWLSDSRKIVLAGQDPKSINSQIWRVDAETGGTQRVTDDSFVYESIGGTPDGRSIVAVKVRQSSHVWLLGDQAVQLTAGFDNKDGVGGLAWSGDGTFFYHSRASGRDAIWRMQMDGSSATEITLDSAGGFAISPNGRLLAFQGKQSTDHLGIQIIDLAGGSQRSLTQNVTAAAPTFFPDGKRIVYSQYDDKQSLHEISIEGGRSKMISQEYRGAWAPSVSPSGKFIAFAFNRVQTGNLEAGIAIIAANDSKQVVSSHPVRIPTGSPYEEPTIQWSSDETEVYFIQIDNSVSNIMKLRLADGSVSAVTNFTDGRIFNFALEPGGSRILVARGLIERDASLFQIDQPL